MKKIEKNISAFVDGFFNYMIDEGISANVDLKKYNALKSIDLHNKYSLRFIHEWYGKNYYLMLYEGNMFRLELFLFRILFISDNKITWYLDTPTRSENRAAYQLILGDPKDIPKVLLIQ